MDHEKKLKFIHQMTKLGLDSIPHFDSGGTVQAFGSPAPGTTLGGPGPATTAGGGNNPNTGVLGTIGGALGITNNYQAGSAAIQPGTNQAQLNAAYTGAQQGINQQQALAGQVQPGLAQGLGAQGNLSGQLANEAAGMGPNPAQSALNQATGNNIAGQAALMASQRGSGANAGATAEMAAREGGAIQQQADGQAATLQAQQQLAAQSQEQQLAAQQVAQGAGSIQGVNQVQQNEQNILQGANTASNNAAVSQQASINAANAQAAAANQGMFGSLLGGVASGAAAGLTAGAMFAAAEGGEVHKMASGGYVEPMALNPGGAAGPQSFVGQWVNSNVSTGPGIQQASLAPLPSMGSGSTKVVAGQKPTSATPITDAGYTMPELGSQVAPADQGYGLGLTQSPADATSGMGLGANTDFGMGGGSSMPANSFGVGEMAKGGSARRMLPPMHGKNAALIARGGPVKAEGKKEKAVSSSDNYDNDKVPALLSEGEVVMDLNTLKDPGPIGQMARTVAHHIATRNASKGAKRV